MLKKTRIVGTIGPASSEQKILEQLIENGLNIARLNFSHGSHDQHAQLIKTIRQAAEAVGETVAILQDLQGPRLRLGQLARPVSLVTGQTISLAPEDDNLSGEFLPIQYASLAQEVGTGQRILLDDGLVELEVKEIRGERIVCEVKNGGVVSSHKGLNIPGANLSVKVLTTKDLDDLKFGLAQGLDAVALSFVAQAKDIYDIRRVVQEEVQKLGNRPEPLVIAKIERQAGIDNLDKIVAEADGVMVARGDLALECGWSQVPILQKQIIAAAWRWAKPVIVATQMLESMTRQPQPTRAEISDIANAVMDHCDGVMLSAETATGLYPLEAVKIMTQTILDTEKSPYDDLEPASNDLNQLSSLVKDLTGNTKVKAIIVFSYQIIRQISQLRPNLPILALASSEELARQFLFSWGVTPMVVSSQRLEEQIKATLSWAKTKELIQVGDQVAIFDETVKLQEVF